MAMSKSDINLDAKEFNESLEMFCEHCDNEGKYATATGFCVDCHEFMCDVCMKYHKKYKSEHVTEDKYDMPQEYCFEKCSIHDKCIKFYCLECIKFACSKCVSVMDSTHEYNCKSKIWSPLDTVDFKTEDISDVNLEKKVADIKKEIKKIENTVVTTKQISSQRNKQVRKLISLHRKEIEQKIRNLENQFLTKIDETEVTYESFVDSVMNSVSMMKKQISSAVSHHNRDKQTSNNRYSRFLAAKNLERDIRSATVELQDLNEKLIYKEQKIEFKAAEVPVVDRKDYGVFVLEDSKKPQIAVYKYDFTEYAYFNRYFNSYPISNPISCPYSISYPISYPFSDFSRYVQSIDPSNLSDIRIHSGFLITVEYLFRRVVLIDQTKKQILSGVKTSSNPAKVAFIEKNKVAVTLPREGKVVFYVISDSASLEKQSGITVEEGCWGLTYSKTQDCLYVSYSEPKSKITIITITGKVIRVLDRDILENKLFKAPEDIALSLNETSLYVTDRKKDMVIKISIDGNVEAVFKDDEMKMPSGIAVDEKESIYVCGQTSGNVLHLGSDLSKVSELINFNEQPLNVAVCEKANIICVGVLADAKIKCFARFSL